MSSAFARFFFFLYTFCFCFWHQLLRDNKVSKKSNTAKLIELRILPVFCFDKKCLHHRKDPTSSITHKRKAEGEECSNIIQMFILLQERK